MNSSFGDIIYSLRTSRDLTLREFAALVGKSPSFISMLENNKNVSSANEQTIRAMAKVLNVDTDQLISLARKVPEAELNSRQGTALKFFRKELKADARLDSKRKN